MKTKNQLSSPHAAPLWLLLFAFYLGLFYFQVISLPADSVNPQTIHLLGASQGLLTILTSIILAGLTLTLILEMGLRRQVQRQVADQRNKYRQLLENSSFTTWTTDIEGNLLEVEGKCKEITGFRAEELVGENFFNLLETDYRDDAKAFFDARMQQSTYEQLIELPIISKSGDRNWTEQNVVVLTEDEAPKGFQIIARDITEKKYAENLLQAAEERMKEKQAEYQERLQAIIDNIPMIIYLKDLEGRFLMVNKTFHHTFGTRDEDLVGHFAIDVHKSTEAEEKFVMADEQIKVYRKPVEIEDVLITRDGERNMLVVKFPLLDKNDKLLAIGGVGKDITENVRHRQQLIKARIRAEKAEKLQEEFLANMSHEIRTPMNGIIGMTNLLLTTELNGEQSEYLSIIRESSGILLSLINDILDISKIKAGRMSIEHIDFNIAETVGMLMAPMKVRAAEKGIQLNCIIDQRLPVSIRGDQHKLKQILNNLVSNAVKFTERGNVTILVDQVEQHQQNLSIRFSIKDTGIGISEENLQLIFESFTQAGNDMVRRFGGTGLGLAITKKLVELQGGQITVSSTQGAGSTFSFTIPFVAVEAKQASGKPEGNPLPANDFSLSGKKILLVEDNLINQKVTNKILTKAGLVVHIANHGREAVEILQQDPHYDAILMDLQMSEMDGFQATTFIRQKLELDIPIIAMTASALRDEKSKCLQIGMNEYLTKPFVPQQLFHHLKRLISKTGEGTTEARKETAQKPLYHLEYLKEMDDDEYAAEVLTLFLDTTPPCLHEIREQIDAENWSEVYRRAHALKSSIGILQIHTLLEQMTNIEQLAKGRDQTDKCRHLIAAAIDHYNLIMPLLQDELDTIKSKYSIVHL